HRNALSQSRPGSPERARANIINKLIHVGQVNVILPFIVHVSCLKNIKPPPTNLTLSKDCSTLHGSAFISLEEVSESGVRLGNDDRSSIAKYNSASSFNFLSKSFT